MLSMRSSLALILSLRARPAAREGQDAEVGREQERRAVMWQCVVPSCAGVPILSRDDS
jgi:hypothetical protein